MNQSVFLCELIATDIKSVKTICVIILLLINAYF